MPSKIPSKKAAPMQTTGENTTQTADTAQQQHVLFGHPPAAPGPPAYLQCPALMNEQ
jgi:hypothetical protein